MRFNRSHLLMEIGMYGAVIVALFAATALAQPDAGIRLLDQVAVKGPDIYLGDVAQLQGSIVKQWEKIIVARFAPQSTHVTVSLIAVRRALTQKQANFSQFALRGYARVHVYRIPDSPVPHPNVAAPLIANSIEPVDLQTALSIRDLLLQWLSRQNNVPREDWDIQLNAGDQKILALSAEQGKFTFESAANTRLGKLALTVRHYRDDALVATHRLRPTVRRRVLAIVARNRLRPGDTLTRANIEVRQVLLNRDSAAPMTNFKQALGMVVRNATSSGSIILSSTVRRPYLVRQGELVTVRCVAGNVVLQTVVRSQEDGSLDDMIRVRNERTLREDRALRRDAPEANFFVRVSGPRQAMLSIKEKG